MLSQSPLIINIYFPGKFGKGGSLVLGLGRYVTGFMMAVVVLSGLLSLITTIFKPKLIIENEFVNNLLNENYLLLIFKLTKAFPSI